MQPVMRSRYNCCDFWCSDCRLLSLHCCQSEKSGLAIIWPQFGIWTEFWTVDFASRSQCATSPLPIDWYWSGVTPESISFWFFHWNWRSWAFANGANATSSAANMEFTKSLWKSMIFTLGNFEMNKWAAPDYKPSRANLILCDSFVLLALFRKPRLTSICTPNPVLPRLQILLGWVPGNLCPWVFASIPASCRHLAR